VQAGIWIEQMTTMPTGTGMAGMPGQAMPGAEGMQGGAALGTTQTTNSITLVCRAVSLQDVDPSANSDMAYAVQNQLQNCKYFDSKATALAGNISPEEANRTFTFGVNLVLTNPPQFTLPQ
jgi:hypothetical protein